MRRLLWLLPMLALSAETIPDLATLNGMIARFAPSELRADVSKLSPGDRKALGKLLEASKIFDDIFMNQLWDGNHALFVKVQRDASPLGEARLHYYLINKGPWSDLDGHTAFVPDAPPKKPAGANFYPPDMTRQEFDSWVKTLPKDQRAAAEGFFTVIRRDANRRLKIVPYSVEYQRDLARCARLLEQAAGMTDNGTLKRFLITRSVAF